jgi:hypothetical protein
MPPIKPSEVANIRNANIPEFVFSAFNELIAKNFSGKQALVMQNSAISLIIALSPEPISREKIFAERWLDVENAYEQAGWKVVYDKPAYNESYEANFTFSR